MKRFSAIVLLVALTGCSNTAQFIAGQRLIVDEAAKIADQNLAAATFSMCRAITVGAWIRAYGSDAAKAEAWRALCAAPVTQTPSK